MRFIDISKLINNNVRKISTSNNAADSAPSQC